MVRREVIDNTEDAPAVSQAFYHVAMQMTIEDLGKLLKISEGIVLAQNNPHLIALSTEELVALTKLRGKVDQAIHKVQIAGG